MVVTRSTLSSSYASYKQKFGEGDFDLRQQALYDLGNDIRSITTTPAKGKTPQDNTYADEHVERQFTNDVLNLVLEDPNSGVKAEAVKCLEIMTAKSRGQTITTIIKGLLDGITSDKEETRDIACPALKRVIQAIPHDVPHIGQNIEGILARVFPILISTSPSPDPQTASELLQILKDIYIRFPNRIAASPAAQTSSQQNLVQVLSTTRNSSIRKRSIEALAALIATTPKIFDAQLQGTLQQGLKQGGDVGNAWISLVAALAREQSIVSIMGALVGSGKIVDVILEHSLDTEAVDSVEAALMTIESLILRCPTEITPYVPSVLSRSLELVKHDPNYVDIGDDDVDMDEDEEEEEDFEDEAYSDEEDQSWKIRRAAGKVILALIGTRNELLVEFYKTAVPVLLSRFNEREDGVRSEILTAVEALLRQTAQARIAAATAGGRNKRKRSEGMDEDVSEETVIQYLRQTHPKLLSATLKQLNSKNMLTRQQAFVLLKQVDEALEGGLESEADQVCTSATNALRSVDTTTTSSLAIAALSFLATFFRHHSARVYASHLEKLVPAIVLCMKDSLQRVSFEAFAAASALAQSLRPQGSASPLAVNFSEPVKRLHAAAMQVLGDSTVDGEVRERAIETLGHLLVHEGDVLVDTYSTCLPLITTRLGTESTAHTAVQVIERIANSSLCKGPVFDDWLLEVLPEIVVALRRTRRTSGKSAEFACLQSLLHRTGKNLPSETAEALVAELVPFTDSSPAISTIAIILSLQSDARGAVEAHFLPQALILIKSPSTHAQLVDALAAFFGIYVDANSDAATKMVAQLTKNLGQQGSLPDATQGGTAIYSATARCIGTVIEHSPQAASRVLSDFQSIISNGKESEAETYLALLCIGEIGRTIDLSSQPEMSKQISAFFGSESEELRSAAAFAIGNIAVGSPHVFLPSIIQQISAATTEANRLLLLHALKEVILHSSTTQLESIADAVWQPLFDEKDLATSKKSKSGAGCEDIGDDAVRNVKAACIGKLTTAAPSKYLPQLQSLLHSSPRNRAIVAAAVRYTFIDTSSAYDELIAPLIVDFLSLMHDDNLIVRRLSLASLNAAIQNKPHLIIDRLATLQPLLFQETHVKPELQRQVQMGPFKITEDDGLENRKMAYETMYTLLGTCFSKVDLPTFTDRVMAALNDVNEIKVLGFMLLLRLSQLSPASVIPRLDDATESIKIVMKDVEVKEDTVKQDLERKEEMQRSALRTAVPLYKMSAPAQAPAFHAFVSSLLAKPEWREYRDYSG